MSSKQMGLTTNTVSCAASVAIGLMVLAGTAGPAAAGSLKLADIVQGGDGTDTATTDEAINPLTGAIETGEAKHLNSPQSQPDDTDSYSTVSGSALIDGAFVPDGGAGAVTLNSNGDTFSGFVDTDSNVWDYVQGDATHAGSTLINNADYSGSGNTVIGLHANKAVTFDLDAIRSAHPGRTLKRFRAVGASGDSGNADFRAFLDGTEEFSKTNVNSDAGGFEIDVPVGSSDRFLTLAASDAGGGFNSDQVFFGNPQIDDARNVAAGRGVTMESINTLNSDFPEQNITDGFINEQSPNGGGERSFWLANSGETGGFVIDLGEQKRIGSVEIQNTHNRGHDDSGTEEFRILVSDDNTNFTEVVDASLADVFGTGHDIPFETFSFSPTEARYVKFAVDSFYDKRAGLNELRVLSTTVIPEPASLALLAPAGLALMRRRRRA